MRNLKEKLLKHRKIIPVAIAIIALSSYIMPIGNPLLPAEAKDKSGDSGKYGGVFPGKGHTGGVFPGDGATGGVFPGKGKGVSEPKNNVVDDPSKDTGGNGNGNGNGNDNPTKGKSGDNGNGNGNDNPTKGKGHK